MRHRPPNPQHKYPANSGARSPRTTGRITHIIPHPPPPRQTAYPTANINTRQPRSRRPRATGRTGSHITTQQKVPCRGYTPESSVMMKLRTANARRGGANRGFASFAYRPGEGGMRHRPPNHNINTPPIRDPEGPERRGALPAPYHIPRLTRQPEARRPHITGSTGSHIPTQQRGARRGLFARVIGDDEVEDGQRAGERPNRGFASFAYRPGEGGMAPPPTQPTT